MPFFISLAGYSSGCQVIGGRWEFVFYFSVYTKKSWPWDCCEMCYQLAFSVISLLSLVLSPICIFDTQLKTVFITNVKTSNFSKATCKCFLRFSLFMNMTNYLLVFHCIMFDVEQFSIECCKRKPFVIIPANHKGHGQSNEPVNDM